MGFGPTGYENKPFAEMSEQEKQAYGEKRDDLLSRLSGGATEPADMKKLLDEACEYGMLYHPDGREVTKNEVENMTLVKQGMADAVSKLIIANHDPMDNSTFYHPMTVMGDTITMDWYKRLTDLELLEKKQEFLLDNRNKKRVDALQFSENARNPLNHEGYIKFFKNMNDVISGLTKENTQIGSQHLCDMISIAIESKIVHFSDGTLPKQEDVAKIARTPADLKNLVFDNYNEDSYATYHENLRLNLSNDEPPRVQLDYMHPLTPADIAQMEQTQASRTKKEDVPGLYAQALKPRDEKKLEKYIAEMKDYNIDIEPYPEAEAFRTMPGKDVYLYGNPTSIKTPDELMKAKGVEPPKEPNSWGIFERIRRTWHNLFGGVEVYEKYYNGLKQYEIDKYYAAKAVGFDVDAQKETVEQYERELAEKREAAKAKERPKAANATEKDASAVVAQNPGNVTDVEKEQIAEEKAMVGEAKKTVENGETVIQNNTEIQNNAPVENGETVIQNNNTEIQNNAPVKNGETVIQNNNTEIQNNAPVENGETVIQNNNTEIQNNAPVESAKVNPTVSKNQIGKPHRNQHFEKKSAEVRLEDGKANAQRIRNNEMELLIDQLQYAYNVPHDVIVAGLDAIANNQGNVPANEPVFEQPQVDAPTSEQTQMGTGI